jgi:hypothetical protein
MGDYDFDPSASRRSPPFKRLSSQKAEGARAGTCDERSLRGSSRVSIFNQVQVSKSSPPRGAISDPRLARLEDAVGDNEASAFTLYSLSEASREIQEANLSASAASVKEVEAAVRLAEELRQRIVDNDQSATEAQAEKLSLATVERLLRS